MGRLSKLMITHTAIGVSLAGGVDVGRSAQPASIS
jgi:hypothetical protein